MNSSNAAKCTFFFDVENNSPKSSATIKRIAAQPTISRILLFQPLKNPFKRMKSAWWIKSHKKMRPSPTTRAKSANHSCKSSKSWQKLCKNTQKPSLNLKA
jgi:hypothetical protein